MSSTTWGGITAPRFTDEDKVQEWDAMSAGEKSRIRADMNGDSTRREAERISMFASDLADQVVFEIENLPPSETVAIREAQQRCPNEFNDERRLDLFLLREDYDVAKAALRLAKYWTQRRKIFGPDKFCLPLTQDGAFRDDHAALSLGLHQILPHPDNSSRVMLYYEPSRVNLKKIKRDSLVRACWYMFEATMESHYIRGGIVLIVNGISVSFDHFDRKLEKAIYELERHFLPIKIRSIHIIKPRSQIFNILKPLWFFLLGRRLRSRSQIHSGHQKEVLESLTLYGITPMILPSAIGGDLVLDHKKWLKKKRDRELLHLEELEASQETKVTEDDDDHD